MFDIKRYKKVLTPTKFCKKCVYPESSAVTLQFDTNGICSGCKVAKNKEKIDWQKKEKYFKRLMKVTRVKKYDCIIPVSEEKTVIIKHI